MDEGCGVLWNVTGAEGKGRWGWLAKVGHEFAAGGKEGGIEVESFLFFSCIDNMIKYL